MTEPKVAETIAEVRATLDQTWALVQEMALIEFKAEAVKRGELADGG